MARLASEAKGGFYATPPEEMALVLKKLVAGKNASLRIADFCCGTGAALAQSADHFRAQGANVVTYGVESEEGRAREAAGLLDNVVYDSYEDLVMTGGIVSFMWLNPPYGYNRGYGTSERTEVAFLRDLTRPKGYLVKGAVLGLCVPKETIYHAARILSYRLTGISIYRFTDQNYERFKQVVLLGYLKSQTSYAQREETEKWLKNVGQSCDYRDIPSLDKGNSNLYRVPPSVKEVKNFYGKYVDPVVAASELNTSPNLELVQNALLPASAHKKQELSRPLLSMDTGQIALAISGGAIDGHMGDFIFKGGVDKITHETQELTETGTKTTYTEQLKTFVRVYSPKLGVQSLE